MATLNFPLNQEFIAAHKASRIAGLLEDCAAFRESGWRVTKAAVRKATSRAAGTV